MDKEKHVKISCETLFELLRLEKTREELQKLDKGFFEDTAGYVNDMTESCELLKNKNDLFAANEKQKADKQLQNIKKMIKELYEKREKKITFLAVDKSRMPSTAIDFSAMPDDEKRFFESMLGVFDEFRKEILIKMIEPGIKNNTEHEQEKTNEKKETKENEKVEQEENTKKENAMIRFLYPVPRFLGTNLEEYGPFDKEDVANIPSELADALVRKGRAEILEE